MNHRPRDVRPLLAALGHASRYRIALSLLDGERCVGDLAVAIGLSQSCTTRHVQALERAGVVRSRRDGKRVMVGIEEGRAAVGELLEWIAPGSAAARTASHAAPPPAAGARPRRAATGEAPGARTARRRAERSGGPRAAGPRRAASPAGTTSADRALPAAELPVPAGLAPAPADPPGNPSVAAGSDPPPAGRPTSGTHATPEDQQAPPPRRPRETLEDFLL